MISPKQYRPKVAVDPLPTFGIPVLMQLALCLLLLPLSSNKVFTGLNAFAWKPKHHHSPFASTVGCEQTRRGQKSPAGVPKAYSQLVGGGALFTVHDDGSMMSLRAGASDEDVDSSDHQLPIPINKNVQSTKGPLSILPMLFHKANDFYNKNFFLVGMFFAVLLAKMVPTLGQNGGILRPELFIGNYGVTMIFFLSGLALQTSELTQAIANVKLNALVQLFIFAVWPFGIGLPLKYLLRPVVSKNLISPALIDGLLILTTLPTTVNMCIMLTSAGGGNVASAICNAVLSNMAGIILTPLLLMHLFGANSIPLPFGQMVWKLCQKVLLPVTVGQLLRRTPVQRFYERHSKTLKRAQEVVLLGIVWNAFCNAFTDGLGLAFKDSLVLLVLLSSLHLLVLGACFRFFSLPPFNIGRPEQVAASFCASQKTLAFGLPLINTIFQGNVNLASYCAPIMFIHPLQMTLGSLLLRSIEQYASGNPNPDSDSYADVRGQ